LWNQETVDEVFSRNASTARSEMLPVEAIEEKPIAEETVAGRRGELPWKPLRRIACFFGVIVLLSFVMHAMVTSGLRHIKTSAFGAENQIMEGKVNAQIVIAGSSRALAHYDPRTIQMATGRTAFNLGRNGAQTDMQVAFLKAYLSHNRKPDIVLFNLDAFTFVTSREIFDPVEYMPYLYDHNLYDALRKINPGIWKSRYIPLYGYVVEDMNFSWVLGLKGFWGRSPREDYFLGFNPRSTRWTDEYERLKTNNPNGVRFEIEPAGIEIVEDLIHVCHERGIQLIFVYSPEYIEMQSLTKNRQEVFEHFHELSDRFNVPMWDYSNWKYAGNRDYFQNSQHLNATGAAVFSNYIGDRLKTYLAAESRVAGESRRLVPTTCFRGQGSTAASDLFFSTCP